MDYTISLEGRTLQKRDKPGESAGSEGWRIEREGNSP